MLKIYVAGRFQDAKKISGVISELEEIGYNVTHNWTNVDPTKTYTNEELGLHAEADIEGVRKAEVLVVYMDNQEHPYIGTASEFGAAIALKIPIIIYNPNPDSDFKHKYNCFYWHKSIRHFQEWSTVISELAALDSVLREELSPEGLINIIGFCGPKGSGKDTSADILKNHNLSNGSLSFAKNLKEICMKVFNLSYEQVYDPILKETDFMEPISLTKEHISLINTELLEYLGPDEIEYPDFQNMDISSIIGTVFKRPRYLLQFIGTDYIRKYVNEEWNVRAFLGKKVVSQLKIGTYCVTDMRFPNEFKYLQNLYYDSKINKFHGYYVHRDLAEQILSESTHESELQVLEVRKLISKNIIYNNGSVAELEEKLLSLAGTSIF